MAAEVEGWVAALVWMWDRPGQSRLTTPRNESDQVEILSGKWCR